MDRGIRCSKCHRYFKNKDVVVVDILNTITHGKCVDETKMYPMKNVGRFEKMKAFYPFFEEEGNEELRE